MFQDSVVAAAIDDSSLYASLPIKKHQRAGFGPSYTLGCIKRLLKVVTVNEVTLDIPTPSLKR